MANKTANVTARVHPEIKQQAEAVLEQLGINKSDLDDDCQSCMGSEVE